MTNVLGFLAAGLLQGFLEWLPVSSSGQALVLLSLILGEPVATALKESFYLHLGTGLAAALYYRRLLAAAVRGGFWLQALVVPLIVGAPVALAVERLYAGASLDAAMALLGAGLAATGLLLALAPRKPLGGRQPTTTDLVLVGLAEGVAALPGVSRSGLTVFVLLARGVGPLDAVRVSFYTAIPASLAAGAYAAASAGTPLGLEGLVGLAASFAAGLAGIRAVEGLASLLSSRLWMFMVVYGLLMLIGAAVMLAA